MAWVLPSPRPVVVRSVRMTWAALGKGRSAGAGRTWVVRRSWRGVAAVVLDVADRGGLPGQGVDSGEKVGLVQRDGEQVERVPAVQVGGVGALGVQGVGDDEVPGQVGQDVQGLPEDGDLVGVGGDLPLRGNGFRVVPEG